MPSTICLNNRPNMTAEQRIEEIKYPLENLENFLMMLSKMKIDDPLSDQEFTSLINTLHQQICQINTVVQTF